MIIAAPVLLIFSWRAVGQQMFALRRRDLLLMLLNGAFLAAAQAAYFTSIYYTGVTIATLLSVCATPLVVSALSILLKQEVLTGRTVIAVALALVGSVLLVGLHSPDGTQYNLPLGAVFALLTAITTAITIIAGRFFAGTHHPAQVTAFTFCAGALVLLPVTLLPGIVPVHSGQGWLYALYLGLVPTAFAYWLFQKGLRHVTATTAAVVTLLEPTGAAILAWLLFGETLAATGVIGAALLIVSILLLSAESPPARD